MSPSKSKKAAHFASYNPMTGIAVWEGPIAGGPEVDAAVETAKEALLPWAAYPMGQRESILKNYQAIVTKRKNQLAETISKETGKPLWESLTEVAAMAGKVDISIAAQKMRCSTIEEKSQNGAMITRHKPLGVVAVLGPFNFPGHLPNGHIVPALLAGNTIVFKPSEKAPLVAETMLAFWQEAGLPKGVLNIVQGEKETGRYLAAHSGIRALLFTGSCNTGRDLAEMFGKTPEKLLALEMGGNNPLVFDSAKNMKAAAYTTLLSCFLTAGQRCTCARRVIVPKGEMGNTFVATFVEMAKKIKAGAYTDRPEPFMGPVISMDAADNLLAAQKNLEAKGGASLLTMGRLKEGAPLLSPGIIDMTGALTRPDDEFFGPLAQVIRTEDFDESIRAANNTSFGLVASILTEEKERYETFYNAVYAGVINWNAPTTGASSRHPFGGVGKSGNFRPSALYAADYCNYPIASTEYPNIRLPEKPLPGTFSIGDIS